MQRFPDEAQQRPPARPCSLSPHRTLLSPGGLYALRPVDQSSSRPSRPRTPCSLQAGSCADPSSCASIYSPAGRPLAALAPPLSRPRRRPARPLPPLPAPAHPPSLPAALSSPKRMVCPKPSPTPPPAPWSPGGRPPAHGDDEDDDPAFEAIPYAYTLAKLHELAPLFWADGASSNCTIRASRSLPPSLSSFRPRAPVSALTCATPPPGPHVSSRSRRSRRRLGSLGRAYDVYAPAVAALHAVRARLVSHRRPRRRRQRRRDRAFRPPAARTDVRPFARASSPGRTPLAGG